MLRFDRLCNLAEDEMKPGAIGDPGKPSISGQVRHVSS